MAALLACGCSRGVNSKDAVRQGVLDYLDQKKSATGLDMTKMNIEVSSVTFQNDEASATVSFNAKGAAGGGMSMNYVLERKGAKWVVKGRKEQSGNPHGASGMPGAMPGSMGQPMPGAPGGTMLPGHPSVGTPAPGAAMPPGHPSVGATAPDKK